LKARQGVIHAMNLCTICTSLYIHMQACSYPFTANTAGPPSFNSTQQDTKKAI